MDAENKPNTETDMPLYTHNQAVEMIRIAHTQGWNDALVYQMEWAESREVLGKDLLKNYNIKI